MKSSTPAERMHFKLSTTLPSKIHRREEKPDRWSSLRGISNPWNKKGGKLGRKAAGL